MERSRTWVWTNGRRKRAGAEALGFMLRILQGLCAAIGKALFEAHAFEMFASPLGLRAV